MSSPDEGSEPRSATAGTTRTPPPRTRRGAPTTRPSFDELDALDALIEPEPTIAAPTTPSKAAKSAKSSSRSGTGTRGRDPGPKPAPGSSKTFDWDTPATTTNRDATVLASAAAATTATPATADPYGEPVEPEIPFERATSPRPAKVKAAKRPERRFRQTVQKVDLWSVTKMALCFYISAMGVMVVSLTALWVVADSAGIIDNVEKFIGDLFSSEDFHFASGQVLRGTVLVGVVVVALMVAFTIIAASFYNIFAELFGGVEIVIREEEQPPKR
ncbi:MAG: DUF3566 domain-containing protein [Acidimicrobiia bacterium]|jgi:hypothetical protein